MLKWNSVDEVLDFAIKGEIESAKFYKGLAAKMEKAWMREVFEHFAKEEEGHQKKLEGVKSGKYLEPSKAKILDLKIGDYLVDIEPKLDMGYQEALILAMKKEKKAFKLYTQLSELADSAELKATFAALAQEEAKHKLRFEVEYDDHILTEN